MTKLHRLMIETCTYYNREGKKKIIIAFRYKNIG